MKMLLDKLLANLDVRVDHFALCMLSSGWRIQLPGPPAVMMHFVLKGQGTVSDAEGNDLPVGPYWLAVVPPGVQHDLRTPGTPSNELRIDSPPPPNTIPNIVAGSSDEVDLLVACGLTRVHYGESLGLFDYLREVLTIDLSESPEALAAFRGILAEQSSPGPGTEAMTSALMFQCLVHLLRRRTEAADCPLPWLSALEDRRLARAMDRILEDPGAEHSVESLADEAGMSRSTFAERFAVSFGRPPMALVHHVRMQRAAHLLKQGALSINEVADRVGFSSRSHFSRAFKTHTGAAPAAYRAQ